MFEKPLAGQINICREEGYFSPARGAPQTTERHNILAN
jgi:hypothetical protein